MNNNTTKKRLAKGKAKSEDWRKEKRNIKGNGYVKVLPDGRIYARLQYTGEDGKRKDKLRVAESKSHAHELLRQMRNELKDNGDVMLEADKITFSEVAAKYEEHKIFEAEYHGERKVAGLRNWKDPKSNLARLVRHFGRRRIRSIRHSDIEAYKRNKLKEIIVRKKRVKDENDKVTVLQIEQPRALASVNRELELMRAVFRFAKRQKWIISCPFEEGEPLISKADETRRERVMSFDEEKKILEACGNRISKYKRNGKDIFAKDSGEKRKHLHAIIITAIDSAMRRGELFKLRWKDIDFNSQTITITAMNSKTARQRTVAMTPRVFNELRMLWKDSPKDMNELVFGVKDTIKTSWFSLCQAAKIDDLRFHDLRHTAITRMVAAGIPAQEVMRISGHTNPVTFLRYVNPNNEGLKRAADILARFHSTMIEANTRANEASEMIN